jgi:hypothetical protein
MAPLFRTDQVGSLLRSQEFLDIQNPTKEGLDPKAVYGSPTDESVIQGYVDRIVEQQLSRNIRPITLENIAVEYFTVAFSKS